MTAPVETAPVRPSRRYVLPALVVAVFAIIVVFFGFGLTQDPRKLPSALLDQAAPAFDLPGLKEGEPGLRTADLKGQVQLVNVFASWCVPCRVEHPLLMRLAKEGKVQVNGIAWKDTRPNASAFLDELGNPYKKIGFDGTGRAGIDWGVYGVPETYVVDAEGRIRYKHVGPLSEEDLEGVILPVLRKVKG